MEITKEGARTLRMKMTNAELYLKEGTVYTYGFQLPAARLPGLTTVKVGKTRLLVLVQLRAQEQAFN